MTTWTKEPDDLQVPVLELDDVGSCSESCDVLVAVLVLC